MTEHDWAPIDLDEDPSEMCNVCFQCSSDWTDECPGEYDPSEGVPSDKDSNSRLGRNDVS